MTPSVLVGRLTLLLGVVALVAGLVGLLAPISVSAGVFDDVRCGSALVPDQSQARARMAASPNPSAAPRAGVPDYPQLCAAEIVDTKQLAWTVLASAGIALAAGTVSEVRWRRARDRGTGGVG